MNNTVDINVDIKKICFIDHIGYGSFGDVYSAKCPTKFGDKLIAVKKLRLPKQFIKSLTREVIILSRLEHPNIVLLYGISIDSEQKLCILYECLECGSLYSLLHSKKHEKNIAPDIYKYFWMLQCAKGIAYLHEKKIIHRDLKTENLLLSNKFRTLKLCDFGTVREFASYNTAEIGTPKYMAPEVASSNKYDTKSDVYSFGIIFWEVMSRKKPFYHLGDIPALALQNRVSQGIRPQMSDIKNSINLNALKELIAKCWHMKSKERLTMQDVLKKIEPYGYVKLENNLFNAQIPKTNHSLEWKESIQHKLSTLNVVHREDIILERKAFASGRFGDVYKAKWRATDGERTIAVKRYNKLKMLGHYFERKLKCISRLNDGNILTLYGISVDNDSRIFLLYEYADCGSLNNVLHGNRRNMKYSYFDALNWMNQCVKGMTYMHDKEIIYRNLKPTTLLFMRKFQTLKICCLSLVNEVDILISKLIGTHRYMAPEVMSGYKYTEKSDVYSFGIVLWEVMSRKTSYSHLSQVSSVELMNRVVEGTRPNLNDLNICEKNGPINELITRCWHSNPEKRPTMKDLLVPLGNLLLLSA